MYKFGWNESSYPMNKQEADSEDKVMFIIS
jgi:hypothetical protein